MHEIVNAVIIDNEHHHVIAVANAMSRNGISCFPIHYQGAAEAFDLCRGISKSNPRIIIIDIQINSTDPTPSNADYANVAKCVELLIGNFSGPYIVLAWSDNTDYFGALKKYVSRYLEKDNQRLPLFFDLIDKTECKTGTEFDTSKIFSKFISFIESQKELRALMAWEKQVIKSAQSTTDEIISISNGKLTSIIEALGIAVAGDNLKDNESAAINESLLYVLRDKISHSSQTNPFLISLWKEAIKNYDLTIDKESKCKLNAALHLDNTIIDDIICPGQTWVLKNEANFFSIFCTKAEKIPNIDRLKGDIITFSSGKSELEAKIKQAADEEIRASIKLDIKNRYIDPFKNAKNRSQIMLLEISPLCDFSNRKKFLNTFVLGLLIPESCISEDIVLKKSAANIGMPIFHDNEFKIIIFSAKHIISFSKNKISEEMYSLEKSFRIRENMLQSWIHFISSYNSRIGTVAFL